MAKAVLYPKKNLVMQMNEVKNISTSSKVGEYYFRSTIGSTNYYETKGGYSLVIVAAGNNVDVRVNVPVKPNTKYRPSVETNGDIHLTFLDNNFNQLTTVYDTISGNKVATSPANAIYVMFTLTNRGLGVGTYFFKNWQLEEVPNDTSPATPFEPYTLINKPAVLYPQKNLFDLNNFIKNATLYSVSISPIKDGMRISSTTKTVYARALVNINLKPNTNYTISSLFGVNIQTDYVYIRLLSGSLAANYSSTNQNPLTFNTGNVVNPVTLAFYITFATAGEGYVDFSKIQLEEGTATPYEPYRLGNKKAK